MERGTIKWFDIEKGYGFILSNIDQKKEYFVHRTEIEDLRDTLDTGQIVEFEIGQGKKGPIAKRVRILYKAQE